MPDCPAALLLSADYNGCVLHRARLPALACQAHNAPVEWTDWNAPDRPALEQTAQVLVLARLHFPYPEQQAIWLATARARGQTVLYEMDDDLLSEAVIPHQLATWPEMTEAQHQDALAARWRIVREVDGITVSTERLATLTRQLTGKPVQVVENRLAWRWWQAVHRTFPRVLPAPVVGWIGGDRTPADFAPMLAAWARIARRFPAVHFAVACGRLPAGLAEAVPADRLHVRPWVTPHAYPVQWRDVDIACLPLADTPFNAYKSNLKALEAACAGAAIVASPPVYRDVLKPGAHALFAETADDWEHALARLIERPKERQAMARRWAAVVQQRYTMERTWAQWPRAWAALRRVSQAGREAA